MGFDKFAQEYVKVPFADFNALKLPPGTEHEADFALLADIFPTVSQQNNKFDISQLMVLYRDGMASNFRSVRPARCINDLES